MFQLAAHATNARTEVQAGVTTFLTMAYILIVNPQILGAAGMPPEDVTRATALSAAIGSLLMGVLANYPIALAPGMGLNAFFAFGVVVGMGVPYQVALTAVFLEGLLFLAMSAGGIRTAVVRAIPTTLKVATSAGIGLFLAMIGFRNAGWVVDNDATLVALGPIAEPSALLAMGGLVLMSALLARGFRSGILAGILCVSVVAWVSGISAKPTSILSTPGLPETTMFALDFETVSSGSLWLVVLTFLFVDFFDTAGTLVGVGSLAGFVDHRGDLPRANRAFAADALATSAGALLGTSTVTSYIESATGIEAGGRTGLTAVTVAVLFALSLVFVPLLVAIPAVATAPALILVGAMMLKCVRDISWDQVEEAVPALLTIAAMPFTYSIANGISLGIVSWTVLQVFVGKATQVHWLLYVLTLLLIGYYGFLGLG